ncbi:hypothetical protein BMETH_2051_0 [methanotrophic bacterial endosymbiont of Bathymodiolus sp.]|nr:hypothetical protein BMETH_2051_0 [methanotrophic bacterial endosymbiont of Bathymodiolus sp.]
MELQVVRPVIKLPLWVDLHRKWLKVQVKLLRLLPN